ncbi:RNA polymerase sigma factor [Sphingomonadaceae bacterium G21617-S1]|nr:RNA polymerase sigma factor [Sphingomonadaceae bacterium G21617-S1]
MMVGNVPPATPANVVRLRSELRDDPKLLETIFRLEEGRLRKFLSLRLGSSSDAQDVAQATFVRLWERRDQLRSDNVTALIYTTARNLATDLLRSKTRKKIRENRDACSPSAAENVPDEAASSERILIARQNLELVLRLIGELPPKCRQAFVAYKIAGLEYSEIADEMGVSESMIRKHVIRAVAHCASRFEQLEGWE